MPSISASISMAHARLSYSFTQATGTEMTLKSVEDGQPLRLMYFLMASSAQPAGTVADWYELKAS